MENFPQSLCNRHWVTTPEDQDGHQPSLMELCHQHEISETLARILLSRGLSEKQSISSFLRPEENNLHDPWMMEGMRTGVERIIKAINGYENILVFGDYDVDGTAAAAIIFNYLKRLGARAHYFIPNRMQDGYSFSPEIIRQFAKQNIDLVITVDHGSTAVEGARIMRQTKIDLIITDHHQLGREIPECVALINPQQKNCPYPFKDLSAAGVAYKVICALDERLEDLSFWNIRGIRRINPSYYLDLVALATVADMTPLVGENRTLVKLGLHAINTNPRPGLSGLIKESRIKGDISPNSISFKLAPKINALGRIGDPTLAVQLFVSHSYTEARKLARQLGETNRKRKFIERRVYEQAINRVQALRDDPACVLVGGDWHPGVIGSIATRLAIEMKKPAIVLTMDQSAQAMGSARSWDTFNILAALEACDTFLDRFGGHPRAAGLSLSSENLPGFTEAFHRIVDQGFQCQQSGQQGQLKIDAWVEPEMINDHLMDEIAMLSPFGYCNPEPILGMKKVKLDNLAFFNNRHLRFHLCTASGNPIDGVAWDHPDWRLNPEQYYDVAFVPQIYQGAQGSRTQLKVLDFRPAS